MGSGVVVVPAVVATKVASFAARRRRWGMRGGETGMAFCSSTASTDHDDGSLTPRGVIGR